MEPLNFELSILPLASNYIPIVTVDSVLNTGIGSFNTESTGNGLKFGTGGTMVYFDTVGGRKEN